MFPGSQRFSIILCFLAKHLKKVFIKRPLSDLRQFLAAESPLKIMRKRFLFRFKSLFRFYYIEMFFLTFLVPQENGLIRKLELISKHITLSTGEKVFTLHILTIITISKDNETMKFDQLIEYNMKIIHKILQINQYQTFF